MPDLTDAASTLALLERYDQPGPRYTSYPTAVEFHDGVGDLQYRERLALVDADAERPLSAYVHLPFCEARCAFCGCNVIITPHRNVAAEYLDALDQEIALLAAALPQRRQIAQMHWGGGTPTYYEADQLARVFDRIRKDFTFMPDAELGIEIDPRVTSGVQLRRLRALGFNRLSMGVQDFSPQVQQAINREQSYELTAGLIAEARAAGFTSVNVDLIYGLPFQTVESFAQTLEQTLTLRPDRVAAYSFAFVPWMRAHMKKLATDALPTARLKLELLALTIDAFARAGYQQIGMDHFALPADDLGQAAASGELHRNFMGYTVQKTPDMVALGVSGIGEVKGAFVQNTKILPAYYAAVGAGRFAVERGYEMSPDDRLRRDVIASLMCNFRVDIKRIEAEFAIDFGAYFVEELAELTAAHSPATDGLVTVDAAAITVTPVGRLFVRNVCMVFDRYLRARTSGAKPVFSRTV
ncbi:MAG: oxygen-independent coproporphyrinogen III oxidase [Acidobacteriota bacterium]|nr:oxygen-independent coproporphyrinogen III oxidase [Acidobacteriota bacterium]